MCRRSEYDLYARTGSKPARTNSKPARSLVEVLRDLFRPRRPTVAQAEVVPFPAAVAIHTDKEADREGSKAALGASREPNLRRARGRAGRYGLQHARRGSCQRGLSPR